MTAAHRRKAGWMNDSATDVAARAGVRILHEQEVRDLIDPEEALAAVRDAFARMGRGETMVPPVMIIYVPENEGEVAHQGGAPAPRGQLRRQVRLDLREEPGAGPAGGLRHDPRVQRRDRLPEAACCSTTAS